MSPFFLFIIVVIFVVAYLFARKSNKDAREKSLTDAKNVSEKLGIELKANEKQGILGMSAPIELSKLLSFNSLFAPRFSHYFKGSSENLEVIIIPFMESRGGIGPIKKRIAIAVINKNIGINILMANKSLGVFITSEASRGKSQIKDDDLNNFKIFTDTNEAIPAVTAFLNNWKNTDDFQQLLSLNPPCVEIAEAVSVIVFDDTTNNSEDLTKFINDQINHFKGILT